MKRGPIVTISVVLSWTAAATAYAQSAPPAATASPSPSPAAGTAAPSLSDYLAAAKEKNPAQRISRAAVAAADAARLEAFAALLPSVSGQANYTWNQYDTRVSFGPGQPEVVIAPHDQEDAIVSARVPIVDGPAIARWRAQRLAAQASLSDERASEQDLLLAVSRAYYGVVASDELVRTAGESKSAAEQNAKIVRTRVAAGTATALFANRADLEIARDEQTLIDAQRAAAVARRSLESLTGLPAPAEFPPPPVTAEEVPAEDVFQKRAETQRPELAAAIERVRVARLAHKASWLQYAPTVSGHGAERWTNATGFTGHEYTWNVGLTLDWQLLEFGVRAGEARKAKAEVLRTEAVLESTRATVRDDVHSAWLDVQAAQAKLAAARRGAEVANQAAAEMRTRFAAGTATQNDLIQTDRDRLSAEVDRIRAEADVAVARLALARAAGDEIR